MDERARNKRKLREVEQEDEEDEDEDNEEDDEDSYVAMDGVEAEKPLEGLKKAPAESNKKQKREPEEEDAEEPVTEEQPATEESKLSKKEQKKAAKKERKAEKKASQNDTEPAPPTPAAKEPQTDKNETTPSSSKKKKSKKAAEQDDDEPMVDAKPADGMAAGLDLAELNGVQASASDSEPHSPTFDTGADNTNATEPASTTTSVSSTIPPSEKPKHIKIPADTSALKARLAAKIEALRAARKADGPDGKPIRTRQELIEARREKQNQRKEHKKEVRRQAKLEEERKREEALASNSPGIMSPAVDMDESGGFSFGRVAFGDGSQMSHDLSYVLTQGKKKGPSDAKTALIKVQNQKKRLEEMDEEARKDIADKDAWLNARRRVEGEKIRDDEAILKKTIKRKESAKKKSEKQWKDRLKGVDQAQKERQRKREDNLRKRRDDKVMGKSGKKKKGGATKKKGGRPGFEGSFGVGGRKK